MRRLHIEYFASHHTNVSALFRSLDHFRQPVWLNPGIIVEGDEIRASRCLDGQIIGLGKAQVPMKSNYLNAGEISLGKFHRVIG